MIAALLILLLGGKGFAGGFATLAEADLERDVLALAAPELEGRDTPSAGLETAAVIIEERFTAAGLAPGYTATGTGSFRRSFPRRVPEPDPEGCGLAMEGEEPTKLALGRDFVPLAGFGGEAEADVVFAGFAIRSRTESWDDFAGLDVAGKVVVLLQGEPKHDRKFEGEELSRAASLWEKIDRLAEMGAAGVLAVRRDPGIAFRHTWAHWAGVPPDPGATRRLPVLEITPDCASAILGVDVAALAERIDKGAKPVRAQHATRSVRLRSRTREANVEVQNLVGLLQGTDPAVAGEHVVVGAHYDHVGVDPRGRIGCGADDNASGVAGMLEIAEALAQAGPRRSVLFCAFAGEEDGLLGSQAFCADPPVPKDRLVAMINLDMIGRGDAGEVAVLGLRQNPELEKVIARAKKLKPTGLNQVVLRQGEELWERSDQFSFHRIGVPALFFFEGLPIERNPDYHTWRDTADKVDAKKMLHTTRLVYNATWILTDDDERPPPPRD